jgi:nitroreductase
MELDQAVLGRRSIRAFLPDPIPRDKIQKIVELARWAPSWGNTQPWEIVVADGEKTRSLAKAFEEELMKGAGPRSDILMPVDFPELHKKRYTGLGRDLLTFLGVARDDSEGRRQHYLNMYKFFGASAERTVFLSGFRFHWHHNLLCGCSRRARDHLSGRGNALSGHREKDPGHTGG